MEIITILRAKKILTMNPLQPEVEVVAIQGDRIYAVGNEKNIINGLNLANRQYEINNQFQNYTIIPGFIETHCHPIPTGIMWKWPYIGFDTRKSPTGKMQNGCKTQREVLERLREHEKTLAPNEPLFAWGYDPALLDAGFPGLNASDLDTISNERLVIVMNMNGHLFYVNNFTLQKANITKSTSVPGVIKDATGNPTGELHELRAIGIIVQQYLKFDEELLAEALNDTAMLAQSAGCTTITDLAIELLPGTWSTIRNTRKKSDFPVRISGYVFNEYLKQHGELQKITQMMAENDTKVRVNGVKFFADGSIQSYTANMEWPYYYDGTQNGLQNIDPQDLKRQFQLYHNAGIQCAAHVNGEVGIDEFIQTAIAVLFEKPIVDHRHRMEHCQTITHTQLDLASKFNLCISFFSNQLYYWGDFHKLNTLGLDRAKYLNPLASATNRHIHYAMHSDAHATPIDPLFCIWAGVTRKTRSGDILGENERISVMQGLKAMTYDGAYILHEEHLKGSIEPAKLADFTILEEDPLSVAVDDIRNIKIIATVLGGVIIKPRI